jgi:hypothetical protein
MFGGSDGRHHQQIGQDGISRIRGIDETAVRMSL